MGKVKNELFEKYSDPLCAIGYIFYKASDIGDIQMFIVEWVHGNYDKKFREFCDTFDPDKFCP